MSTGSDTAVSNTRWAVANLVLATVASLGIGVPNVALPELARAQRQFPHRRMGDPRLSDRFDGALCRHWQIRRYRRLSARIPVWRDAVHRAAHGTARGVTSGMLSLSRGFGFITGTAVLGSVFAAGAPHIVTNDASAVAAGMRPMLLVGAGMLLVAFIVSVRRLPSGHAIGNSGLACNTVTPRSASDKGVPV